MSYYNLKNLQSKQSLKLFLPLRYMPSIRFLDLGSVQLKNIHHFENHNLQECNRKDCIFSLNCKRNILRCLSMLLLLSLLSHNLNFLLSQPLPKHYYNFHLYIPLPYLRMDSSNPQTVHNFQKEYE